MSYVECRISGRENSKIPKGNIPHIPHTTYHIQHSSFLFPLCPGAKYSSNNLTFYSLHSNLLRLYTWRANAARQARVPRSVINGAIRCVQPTASLRQTSRRSACTIRIPGSTRPSKSPRVTCGHSPRGCRREKKFSRQKTEGRSQKTEGSVFTDFCLLTSQIIFFLVFQ